jgi:hypothetical protein
MVRIAVLSSLISVVLFSSGVLHAQGNAQKPGQGKTKKSAARSPAKAVRGAKAGKAGKAARPLIDAQIEAMDQLYAELIEVIKNNKSDSRRDDLPASNEKREAVVKALDEYSRGAKQLLMNDTHLGMNYVRFAETTFPRLSGRVVKVGPKGHYEDLQTAVADIEPGDVVLLGEGEYVLPKFGGEWRDIAFVGLGHEKTTLTCQFQQMTRVRLAALKIDCKDDECIYLRKGGSAQIMNCLITNYNSGAGGSNSISGTGATLLIEDSRFEGMTGRAQKRGSGGNAFDLRGTSFLYVRKTDFIDNQTIVRVTSFSVFDRCRSMSRMRSETGVNVYDEGTLVVRRNLCKIKGEASAEFEVSTDDRAVVKYLMDPKAELDALTKAAVEALGLRDNPRYWATLLHHSDREVRFIAWGRLTSLLRGAMPKIRIAKKVIYQVPLEMRDPFEAALRSSKALQWLEENEPNLTWSDKRRAYVLKK